MENIGDGERESGGGYTEDGTCDLKGRPVLRSKRGGWRACSFIVGYEVVERLAYYGIATNLIVYLTTKLHEGTVVASNNVTNWAGTVWLTPILGAYIADAHLGRYWTFVISSFIYLVGLCLLTLSVTISPLKPSACNNPSNQCPEAPPLQSGVFFFALYIVAIGTGGTKPNISTMGAEQFDDFEPKERTQKLSFFNWWMFSIFFGTLFAHTFLVYVQDNVGWTLGYGLPAIFLFVAVVMFLVGSPFYRHRTASGSPFVKIAQVIVAAGRKWKVAIPSDPKQFHEIDIEEYTKKGQYRIEPTTSLRFLDRAAVKSGPTSPWMLCTLTQVEETKQMIKMLPILIATFLPSTILAQAHTLFIKQGTLLDRYMGPHFKIPPASLAAFITIFMLVSLLIYEHFFVPLVRKYTKNPRGISLLTRMGIGMVIQILVMVIASLVERRRLQVAKDLGLLNIKDILPLTIFVLLPQFALLGIADAFVEVAKIEFFYDQAPETMKSIGTSYFTSSLGIGNFLSSFLLKTVSSATKRNREGGWIENNLNISHLDYYYGLLAALAVVNIIYFVVVAKFYVYRVDPHKIEVDVAKISAVAEIVPNHNGTRINRVLDVEI